MSTSSRRNIKFCNRSTIFPNIILVYLFGNFQTVAIILAFINKTFSPFCSHMVNCLLAFLEKVEKEMK